MDELGIEGGLDENNNFNFGTGQTIKQVTDESLTNMTHNI